MMTNSYAIQLAPGYSHRAFAEINHRLILEEQRTQNLQERLAQAEGDIERIQDQIGRITCAPTVSAHCPPTLSSYGYIYKI